MLVVTRLAFVAPIIAAQKQKGEGKHTAKCTIASIPDSVQLQSRKMLPDSANG